MTTGQLILILILVLVAALIVAVILRRGATRRDEQRVEAATLRSDAEEVAATMTGQAAFADQAEERADVAREEAEAKAREAAHLEAEAAVRREGAEATRQEYEAMMRRADDVDPDVSQSSFPPVPEDAGPAAAPEPGSEGTAPASEGEDEDLPMTRAERRRAREEAELQTGSAGSGVDDAGRPSGVTADEWSSSTSGSTAPVAGAAGAAAVGTAAWAAHRDEETAAPSPDEERSARIAAAVDYRDEVGEPEGSRASEAPAAAGPAGDVCAPSPVGTSAGMSETPRTDETTDHRVVADARADAETPSGEWGGPATAGSGPEDADAQSVDTPGGAEATEAPAGADVTMIADPDAFAATEPVVADEQAAPVEPVRPDDAGTGLLAQEPGSGADSEAADEETPPAGAAPDEGVGLDAVEDEGTDAVILADAEAFAATEPVLADGSTAAERPTASEDASGEAADEPLGAEPVGSATPADEEAQGELTGEDDDEPDWAADEGHLLDENRERGEHLAADREALEEEAAHTPHPAGETAGTAGEEPVSEQPRPEEAESPFEEVATDEPVAEASRARRVSEFHEIRDGGFGVGSAAPIEDGAMPMDHPVAAYRDTMTYRAPGDPGYDAADPDVWFYDEGAAERSGFRRSEG